MYWYEAIETIHKILALRPAIPLARILWTTVMILTYYVSLSLIEVSDKAKTKVACVFIQIISVTE